MSIYRFFFKRDGSSPLAARLVSSCLVSTPFLRRSSFRLGIETTLTKLAAGATSTLHENYNFRA